MSKRPLSTMERAAAGSLALAVLASGLYFARQSGTNPDVYGNDFSVYYHAAREVIAGHDPYQHSLGDWTPYLYPPLLAELTVPLAILPLPVAAYVWFLINAVSIVAAAWMSASIPHDKAGCAAPGQNIAERPLWRGAIAACAVALVVRFVLDTFNLGQVNAVVVALAVAHVYLYSRDRKTLSALALVVAASIKLTPALLLVYHIAKLRLKFSVACAALLVGVTALSFLPFGSGGRDAFQTFWNRTVKNEQGYDFAYSGNQSLRGAIARLIGNSADDAVNEGESRKPAERATILLSVVLLALAVFAAIRARTELAGAAPFFCCLVLLSPLSWKAHYIVLILPLTHLIFRAKTSGTARIGIAMTLAAAFVLFNLTSPRVISLAAAEWADAHSLVFAGALLVYFVGGLSIAGTGSE